MACETFYGCDWCGVKAPIANSYPATWTSPNERAMRTQILLCEECTKVREDAIQIAKAQRTKAIP